MADSAEPGRGERALENLLQFISDPQFDEQAAITLLARRDLPADIIEKLARRPEFPESYAVLRALAFHVNVPRVTAKKVCRKLHLMDTVKLSVAPALSPDIQRIAEDELLFRLPRLALGQMIAVARQASARVLAALILEGNAKTVGPALDNPRFSEAQVLKILSSERLPAPVVPTIARHTRWPKLPNVRTALLRHPQTPYEIALRLLRQASLNELRTLLRSTSLTAEFRRQVERAASQR